MSMYDHTKATFLHKPLHLDTLLLQLPVESLDRLLHLYASNVISAEGGTHAGSGLLRWGRGRREFVT